MQFELDPTRYQFQKKNLQTGFISHRLETFVN